MSGEWLCDGDEAGEASTGWVAEGFRRCEWNRHRKGCKECDCRKLGIVCISGIFVVSLETSVIQNYIVLGDKGNFEMRGKKKKSRTE